jgi:hypothetical protein
MAELLGRTNIDDVEEPVAPTSPAYTGELLGQTRLDYDDPDVNLFTGVKVSKWEGAKASLEETYEQLPTVALNRFYQLRAADDRLPSMGVEDYGMDPEDLALYMKARDTLDDEAQWKKEYGNTGLKFEKGHTKDYWDLNAELKQEELGRKEIIESSEIGMLSQFGLGIVPNLLDPINVMSAFIPITTGAKAAALIGKVGGGAVRKTATAGAIEGFVGNIPTELAVYGALVGDRQYDYSMADAAVNLLIAPVIGSAWHVAWHSTFGRNPFKEVQAKALDAIDNGKSFSAVDVLDNKKSADLVDAITKDEDYQKAKSKLSEEEQLDWDRAMEAARKEDDLVGKLKEAENERITAEESEEWRGADDEDLSPPWADESYFETIDADNITADDAARIAKAEAYGTTTPAGIAEPIEFKPGDITEVLEKRKVADDTTNIYRQKNIKKGIGDLPKGAFPPRTQKLLDAFETVTTEVLEKLNVLQKAKDAYGSRLLTNNDFDFIVQKSIKINEKLGQYQQNVNDFYTTGKEILSKNPTMTWKQVADRWGGNQQDFMRYLAKRFDGAKKVGMDIDKLPESIINEMIDNATKQHTSSVLSLVRYAENVEKLTRLSKANNLTEMNVLLADMIGTTSLGLLGRTEHFAGLRNSIDGIGKSIERGALGKMRAMLENYKDENGNTINLWKLVEKTRTYNPLAGWVGKGGDKLFQLQIRKALWSIDLETGKAKLRDNENAARIAEVIHAVNKELVDRQNAAGGNIDMRKEYGAKQRHMREKLIKAGKEEWKKYIKDKLDLEKSFGKAREVDQTLENKRIDEILDKVYEHATKGGEKKRGYDSDFDDGWDFSFGMDDKPKTLGEKISAERVLIFKSAEAQDAYDMKYGSGDLMDNIFNSITKSAGNIALMSKYGPDPDGVFNKLLNKLDTISRQTNTGNAELDAKNARLAEELRDKKDWLQRAYDDVSGVASRPSDVNIARIGRNIRAWHVITKLGTAMISSFGDTITAAEALRFQGIHGYRAWTGALGNTLAFFHKSSDKKEVARLIGIGLDGMISDVMSRYANPEEMGGRMSKAMGLMFKLNGLEHWTDSHKFAAGLMLSSHLAGQRGSTLSQIGSTKLGKKLARQIKAYDIDDVDWEIIRKHGISEVEGNHYITSDAISTIPDDVIRQMAGDKLKNTLGTEVRKSLGQETGNVSDAMVRNYRRELGDKLRNYLIDFTDQAVPTPGARQRITMRGTTTAGTIPGEAMRFFWQFKSFPITVFQQAQERIQVEGGFGSAAGLGSLTALTAGLTAAGYASLTVKDFINGKKPRTDAGVLVDALAQGGVMGIWGDLALSDARRYGQSPVARFLGPTYGMGEDAFRLFIQDTKGFIPGELFGPAPKHPGRQMGSDAVKFFQRHVIPGLNFPIMKQMMEYSLLHSLQESINPGYLRRVEKNMKKDRDQEYFDYGMNIANPRNRWRTFE